MLPWNKFRFQSAAAGIIYLPERSSSKMDQGGWGRFGKDYDCFTVEWPKLGAEIDL
jgi:hypothetical protein